MQNPAQYNRHSFYRNTFCLFSEVRPEILSEIILGFLSKSGSQYYFTEEGVYRKSHHWGRAANCRWRLLPLSNYISEDPLKVGFARWRDFYPNNDFEKLFYITAEISGQIVTFHHKNNPNFNGTAILRTAAETAKHIKLIRTLLTETSWAKYLEYDNINLLREKVINSLINTSKSFHEIKRSL
jgi:hypothetical protein